MYLVFSNETITAANPIEKSLQITKNNYMDRRNESNLPYSYLSRELFIWSGVIYWPKNALQSYLFKRIIRFILLKTMRYFFCLVKSVRDPFKYYQRNLK